MSAAVASVEVGSRTLSVAGQAHHLPEPATAGYPVEATEALRALGWTVRGHWECHYFNLDDPGCWYANVVSR